MRQTVRPLWPEAAAAILTILALVMFVVGLADGRPLTAQNAMHGALVGSFAAMVWSLRRARRHTNSLAQDDLNFRELAELMPQIVYTNNANGEVDFANRRWADYTGQSGADTRDLSQVVHPDDLPRMVGAWNRARETMTVFEAEFRLRRASDGAYRWFLTRSVPMQNAAGEVERWFGTSTDIHDQKLAEQQLADSEARYRTIALESERSRRFYEAMLSNIADFVYVFSLEHTVLYANAPLIHMWGRGVEGAIGKTFLEIGYEPWHAAMHDREIDLVRFTKHPIRGEVPFTGTNGTRQYEYIFVPIIGEDGEVEAVAGTTRDITDRLITEEALRTREEQHAYLVELNDALRPLSDAVSVQAEASRRLAIKLGAERVAYFEVRESDYVVEQDFTNGVPSIRGRLPMTAFGHDLQTAFRSGRTVVEPDVGASKHLSESERRAYAAISVASHIGVPLVKDGVLVAGLAVNSARRRIWTPWEVALVEETAERTWAAVERVRAEAAMRASEERFRTLFSSMDEGFCVALMQFDADGRAVDYEVELMNPAFEKHTGLSGLTGRSIKSAIPQLEDFWFDTYGRVANTGEPARFVHRTEALDGRWFEVSAFRFGNEDSRRVAMLFTDISRRVNADEEREHLVERLQELDRRKDEFLATLAHELRNPLAPISNGLELLKRAKPGESTQRTYAMMERQVGHLVRLVDDLLDVNRVTTGKLELRYEPVALRAIVTAELDASRSLMTHAGVQVSSTLPDDPVMVYGDPVRLAQIVSNLLTNAAKYTPRDGHVQVTLTVSDGLARLVVSDDGIGIPADMLRSVFNLFTQVDRSIEKSTGGLGIGLSLAQGLVSMHGGTIEAQSKGEGRGSSFIVQLPLLDTSVALLPPRARGRRGDYRDAPRRVLIIDDNADAAESLAGLLTREGHEVRTALSGEQGVRIAQEFHPDVVVCDIGMPEMSGYETARRIRAEPWARDVVLVALTGWGKLADRRRSAEAGFDHHLVKPVDARSLMSVVLGRDQLHTLA